jgi:hypothetical protein
MVISIGVIVIALILAIIVGGFSSYVKGDDNDAIGTIHNKSLFGVERFNLKGGRKVTRAILKKNEFEIPDVGLHSYLLFGAGADIDAGRSNRLAAVRAYLKVIPEFEIPSTVLGKEDLQLAFLKKTSVLYIFAKADKKHDLEFTNQFTTEEQRLLMKYDYLRAKELLEYIGIQGDGIYIVSYFDPLSSSKNIDKTKLLVQDLSRIKDKRLIEMWVKEYRKQAKKEKYWDKDIMREVMLRVRTELPEVAALIKFTNDALAGE